VNQPAWVRKWAASSSGLGRMIKLPRDLAI
jgi:hypothetical protein